MKYINTKATADIREYPDRISYDLLTNANGCQKGCKAGLTEHRATEFPEPQVHEDQEGFYVISGKGWILLDNEKYRVEPDTSLIVPPGVRHAFIRDADVPCVKVFWFHAAI